MVRGHVMILPFPIQNKLINQDGYIFSRLIINVTKAS